MMTSFADAIVSLSRSSNSIGQPNPKQEVKGLVSKTQEPMQTMKTILPGVLVRVTRRGPVLKVAVITAHAIHWRTYPPMPVDMAAARALKSCGLTQATMQGHLES